MIPITPTLRRKRRIKIIQEALRRMEMMLAIIKKKRNRNLNMIKQQGFSI